MGHKANSIKILKDIECGKFREKRMVNVIDDWYPCFKNNQICLSITLNSFRCQNNKFVLKISAFGADDTGVCLEYHTSFQENAIHMYNHWKKWVYDKVPDGCSMEWFFEHGFHF